MHKFFYWNPWSHFLIIAVLEIYTFVKIIKFVSAEILVGRKLCVGIHVETDGKFTTKTKLSASRPGTQSLMAFRLVFKKEFWNVSGKSDQPWSDMQWY